MTLIQALLAFAFAAGLLTVTPGLDTAIVLRASALEGRKAGIAAAAGITLGLMVWGTASAIGLTALLAASSLAYMALKWIGAAYLVVLGLNMLLRPKASVASGEAETVGVHGPGLWLRRGLLTNLLNPKVGVFYVAFLPQFTPPGAPTGPFIAALVAIHIVEGAIWFAALIAATEPLGRCLRRPEIARRMNRLTGAIFIGFGAKLALSRG
ncbi:MAG TPA: LysE family translocator [Caulobacteraceae bacterium]|jgi:threonine/homoserine/homoserine lactone efflux protein|nr:LysE family translocator [Caulobacteraceae bacterium]